MHTLPLLYERMGTRTARFKQNDEHRTTKLPTKTMVLYVYPRLKLLSTKRMTRVILQQVFVTNDSFSIISHACMWNERQNSSHTLITITSLDRARESKTDESNFRYCSKKGVSSH